MKMKKEKVKHSSAPALSRAISRLLRGIGIAEEMDFIQFFHTRTASGNADERKRDDAISSRRSPVLFLFGGKAMGREDEKEKEEKTPLPRALSFSPSPIYLAPAPA